MASYRQALCGAQLMSTTEDLANPTLENCEFLDHTGTDRLYPSEIEALELLASTGFVISNPEVAESRGLPRGQVAPTVAYAARFSADEPIIAVGSVAACGLLFCAYLASSLAAPPASSSAAIHRASMVMDAAFITGHLLCHNTAPRSIIQCQAV